ncbi:hypothetical protein EON83_04575 [bacterium]|nr:MAG: hypothetical protein EON83_04575 [bacterium]
MTLFLPLEWLSWVSAIFGGFTFTDWYDFIPLCCLTCGLIAVGLSRLLFSRPASLCLKGILIALATWPLYPLFPLTMMAWQVVKVRGAWPQVMIDDPRNLIGLSRDYDFWLHAVSYTQAIAGATFVTFIAMLCANQKRLSRNAMISILGVCGATMLLAIADPLNLSAWWLD